VRLTRLRLNQICQFAELDWQFENGLVGIYGPNGAGKSNSMNVGCYAGFTGDYSRHVQGKEGMIRQQADPSQNSAIRVNFTHDGGEFELLRSLRAPSKSRLRLPNGQELTKANEIAAHLEETLRIRRQLIDHFVFVGQGELFAFLSAVASERARAFAYLCDTVKAEKIWELLAAQTQADAGLAAEIEDNRDELRQVLGTYEARLKTALAEEAEARAGLLSREAKEAADRVAANWRRQEQAQQALETAAATEATRKAAAVEAYKPVKRLETQLQELETEYAGDAERLQEIAGELATIQQQQRDWSRRQGLIRELSQLPAPPAEPQNPNVDEEAVADRLSELIIEIDRSQRLVESLEGLPGVCPTCGQPTETLQETADAARNLLPGLQAESVALTRQQREANAYSQAMTKWRHDCEFRRRREEDLQRQLVPLAQMQAPGDATELLAERNGLNARATQLKQARVDLATAKQRFEAAKGAHKESLRQVEHWTAEVEKYQVSQVEFDAATEQLEGHIMANRLLAAAEARRSELENFIQQQQQEIERVGVVLARSVRGRHWLRTLNDVRDYVMHRDKLPHLVHQAYLQGMENEINATLELFESPFHVKTTEDISFTAFFQNGTVMPAGGLSGGQKVMLAMAFRMTVNSLFAPQVGMMVLDEPTDGLDADNRNLAAGVFRRLGELARSRGHQVIIVTHDEALRTAFDQVFVLERAA
jgi:DNA repair exonuclease SbcCD ATPase subunit